jgi:hypothetical protein
VPACRKVTVEPATVQAALVVAGSMENVTGLPESPPVAVTT